MIIFAWGHGGQYIIMIPELDAVIVMTSSVTIHSQRRLYKQPIFELLEASIIPFLEKLNFELLILWFHFNPFRHCVLSWQK